MEKSSSGDGSEVAAMRSDLFPSGSDAGEDRLSALPDDILVLILLRLDTITEAARTCVLARRWRRTWALLPELTFRSAPDNRHVLEVLAVPEAPALRRIHVATTNDAPESVAAWLPLAARRLSGGLVYHNLVEGHEEEEEVVVDGAIPLPCFGNATAIDLDLGYCALTLPSSGTFTRLTELCLERIRFQGTCELGDIVSSPRCPCLRKLHIRRVRGVAKLTVHSESLLEIDLFSLYGLQLLNINAPVLNHLALKYCFIRNQEQPIANISAPQLLSVTWMDAFDPSFVHHGSLGQLEQLCPDIILVYGQHPNRLNREVLRFLQHFQAVDSLAIVLGYPKAQWTCPSGCICDQPTNWKIEKLSLDCLQEVEITNLKGAEHEAAFLKRLLNWAGVLEKLRITFDYSVSKNKAKELCQRLSSIFRPETIVEFYEYSGRRLVDSLLLEDEGTGV